MYLEIFTVIAPIFICVLLGFSWARLGYPYEQQFVSNLVSSVGAPCLIVGTLSKVGLSTTYFNEIVVSTVMVLSLSALIAAVGLRIFGLSIRAYLAPLVFPNTGNIGLPLCLFAFGEEGLAMGIGIFLLMAFSHFSVGIAVVSGTQSLNKLIRSPIILSALFAISLVYTQTQLPDWLTNTLTMLGNMSIPLMLITLGVSLDHLKVKSFFLSTYLAVGRLLIGVGIGLLVCNLLELEGALRGAVIIQSAMPAAVFNYLIAQRFDRAPEVVAGMVVMSTVIGFLTLPLLLLLVL